MIDALLYAVRDGIRYANIGYGHAETEIMDNEKPPPRCGGFFASIHDGTERSDRDNQLMSWYDFSVTLTARIVKAPLDRVGDQLLHLNVLRDLAVKQGFFAKVEQLRALIHMNWRFVVLTNQTPNSANDNISAWCTGTVYGFVEPMRYLSVESAKLVGGEWFASEADSEDVGVKATLKFGRARRMQPTIQSPNSFV